MRAIRIQNPILNLYITDVSTDYTSGTSLLVRSNNSFSANDLIVVGHAKEELTEEKKVNVLVGNTELTLASDLKFQHNKGTPIYKALWDFVSIEGRSTSAGVFAELTDSPIQWDNQEDKTIYLHSDGTDTWEYRFRFHNSVTSTYSEYSPTLTGEGFTKFQMGYIIKKARLEAGDKEGRILTTDECLQALTRAKNIIRGHNPKYWFWKVDGFKSDTAIPATSDTSIYSLASVPRFGTLDLIHYVYLQGNTNLRWVLKKKTDIEFFSLTKDMNRPAMDQPTMYRLLPADDDSPYGYFEIENKTQNNGIGTFYISYYKEEDDYTSVGDRTSLVMPEIYCDYLKAIIYETKGNQTMADKFYDYFTGPENREKTLPLEKLSGIALLDELDRQYKVAQGQPRNLWNFKGQQAMGRLFGDRSAINNPDYIRENYFDASRE